MRRSRHTTERQRCGGRLLLNICRSHHRNLMSRDRKVHQFKACKVLAPEPTVVDAAMAATKSIFFMAISSTILDIPTTNSKATLTEVAGARCEKLHMRHFVARRYRRQRVEEVIE